ncbi:MAG: hypothetical protein O2925_02890 [Actinomycetota bacterium]|jgi:hypothetical protein|nr:hypothetical protein [Actinomycetota bacterium]MDA3015198.1 hypothetical protein [Actinomycetota bacterium]MDA3027719.1 hypothetical protein [Actinomycetota bacterium]
MRWLRGSLLACAFVIIPARVVSADAPGPTDFESVVVDVTADGADGVPDTFSIKVEGVDSFLWLNVDPGSTATIPGYDAEPYLRIDADCSVWQNRLSWSAWYNEDRYGDVVRPDFVDPDATPEWEQIDDDCSVAWHDHRIHWMESSPPIGAEPGDVVISSLVPFTVDDVDVAVRVESTLLPAPSARPSIAGLILGMAAVAAVLVFGGRRLAAASMWLGAVSLVALIVGVVTYATTPADTGPNPRWWVLPLGALIGGAAGVAFERSGRWFWANGALLVSGVVLSVWVWDRRTGLWRALIPSPWPGAVDRVVTAGAAVVAVAAIAGALAVLISPGVVRSDR